MPPLWRGRARAAAGRGSTAPIAEPADGDDAPEAPLCRGMLGGGMTLRTFAYVLPR
jgi:hypothetical protein